MFSWRNEENRIWGKGTKCKPSIKFLYFLYSHTATLSLLIKTISLLSAIIFPESKLQHQERWHRVWRIDCKPFREHQKLQQTASTCVESLFKWRVVSTRDFGSGCVFMCSRHAHTHTLTVTQTQQSQDLSWSCCLLTETAFSELECLWLNLLTSLLSKHAEHILVWIQRTNTKNKWKLINHFCLFLYKFYIYNILFF